MNFTKEQQTVDRIKSLLNTNNLVNNEQNRSLYNDYFMICERAKARLDLCNRHLRQNLKAEALAEVKKEPDLRKVIQILNFPEREKFQDLCHLYDWPIPAELNISSIKKIQDASQSYTQMHHLLEQYRTISRTDLHHDKLVLLREIIQKDMKNPEWLKTIKDVEILYLKELLDRAKNDILNEKYEDLEEIHHELTEEKWHISIPVQALDKIMRVLNEYRARKNRETAQEYLFQIDSAYSAHDFASLQTALVDWKRFCFTKNYQPEEMEKKQVQEAVDFLEAHNKKIEKQQRFDQMVELLVKKIENRDSLESIEQDYIQLKSMEMPIPDFIENSIEQVREDTEHEQRMHTIIKAVKTISITVIILAVIIFAGYTAVNMHAEKQKGNALKELIEQKKFDEANALYQDIYQKNPSLAMSTEIKKQKLILDQWNEKEKERKDSFEALLSDIKNEINNKLKFDADNLKKMVDSANKLAKSEKEKSTIRSLEIDVENKILEYKNTQEALFREKINIAAQKRKIFFSKLEHENYEVLNNLYDDYKAAVEECKRIKGITYSLQESDLLDVTSVYKELRKVTNEQKLKNSYNTNLANSKDIDNVISVMEQHRAHSNMFSGFNDIYNDAKVLKAYINAKHQNNNYDLPKSSYYKDLQDVKEYQQRIQSAYSRMLSTFKDLMKLNLYQITFQPPSNSAPIYIIFNRPPSMRTKSQEYVIQDFNKRNMIISNFERTYLNRRWGGTNEQYAGTIVYPADSESFEQKVQGKKAVHLILNEKIYNNAKNWKQHEFPIKCIEQMKMICETKYCIPYWKARHILTFLNNLQYLESNKEDTPVIKLKNALMDYKNKIDKEKDFTHKNLNRELDEYLKTVNFSEIEKYLKRLTFNTVIKQIVSTETFIYLGAVINGIIPVKFPGSTANLMNSGDIFCLTKDGNNRVFVGTFSAENGVRIFPEYRQFVNNRLLFTAKNCKDIRKLNLEIRNIAKGNDIQFQYPDFWPINTRNGE